MSVFVLSIVLSSAPLAPQEVKEFEFPSKEECEEVIPALEQLYLALGNSSVQLSCSPKKKVHSALESHSILESSAPLPSGKKVSFVF